MGLFSFLPPGIARSLGLIGSQRRRTLDWLAAELANAADVEPGTAREALMASLPVGDEDRLDDGGAVVSLLHAASGRLGVVPPNLVPPTVN